jgi:hypothetical protein
MNAEQIAAALGGKRAGNGFMAPCPAHGDRNPSLSLADAGDKVLAYCFGGCSQDAVVDALRSRGLWHASSNGATYAPIPAPKKPAVTWQTVPADADPWEIRHFEHGKPSATWKYLDKEGRLLGIACRFDFPDGSKVVMPYTHGTETNLVTGEIKTGWRFKAFTDPRPLYGLDRLAAKPDAPVVVVEGEKAAEAASKLFPGHVAVTWPGGSKAVDKADWSPIKGRHITIWPDADAPGHKAVAEVAKRCRQAGAAGEATITPPEGVAEGWDAADALAEGWTPDRAAELIKMAQQPPRGNGMLAPKRQFSLIKAGALKARAPEFLVDELVEVDSLGLLFGDSAVGKSFIAVDLALSVTTGTPFHGRSVARGPVVYIAGEGHNGLSRRFLAWSVARGKDYQTAPLYVSTMPASLLDGESLKQVASAIDEVGPVLIVVDTLARNYGPGDENSSADMSAFVDALDVIRRPYKATMLVIHHTGHADKSRSRGSYSLKCALDFEYHVFKDAAGTVFLKNLKMKDGPQPETLAFTPRAIDLHDEQRQSMSSLAFELIDSHEPQAGAKKLPDGQRIALQALAGLLVNKDSVHVTEWRAECYAAGISDTPDGKKKAFQRARKDLLKDGLISTRDDQYWIAGQPGHYRDMSPNVPGTSGTYGTHSYRSVPCPGTLSRSDDPGEDFSDDRIEVTV